MKKKGFRSLLFVLILILIICAQFAYAASDLKLEDEIKKATHYAEDYETGNINYAQMVVYMAAVKEDIDSILYTSYKNNNNFAGEEYLKSILGESTETTQWAWSDKKQKETKLDHEVSGWRKPIFDGKKVQINLEAWPQILEKENSNIIYYNTHLGINFKDPKKDENFDLKIGEITNLAESYKENPSNEKAEELADKTIEAEKPIQSYLQENAGKCEDIMNKVIGSAYKRDENENVVKEIKIYVGDNGFESKARLEYCDTCENSWIGLNVYSMDRTLRGSNEERGEEIGKYKELTDNEFESELTEAFNDYKKATSINEARPIERKIRTLHNSWMQKANDVHEEVDKIMQEKRAQSQGQNNQDDRDEQNLLMKDIQKKNYEKIKSFYLDLFSSYEQKEYHFTQINYERKLVEQTQQFSQEICSNSVDDDSNGNVDCEDNSCNAQSCGSALTKEIVDGQEIEVTKQMFCIEKKCQLPLLEQKEPVCGNKICEVNETETCSQDCSACQQYPPLECNGQLIFKGNDEKGCPLEPICLEKTTTCQSDTDCSQPLCGTSSCIEGICKVTVIEECKQAECIAGDKNVVKCESGKELVTKLCVDGLWKETGQNCIPKQETNPEQEKKEFICDTKDDCSSNDVCSNGQCVTLPEIKEISRPESENNNVEDIGQETKENNEQPKSTESIPLTGVTLVLRKITGFAINGFDINEEGNSGEQNQTPEQINQNEQNQENNDQRDRKEDKQEQPREPDIRQTGGFSLYGSCRTSKEKKEGWVSYNGWGSFDKIQKLKERYNNEGNSDWCKREFRSLLLQRKELENSLNKEFATWFFEEYLANSADEWEKRNSGIYELYWRDIEISKQLAMNAKCAGESYTYNPINFEYDTSYGSIKFSEEMKKGKVDNSNEELDLISPYMTIWIFPSKEFVKYEFKKAMEEQKFPGSHHSIEEDDQVLEDKDREKIKADENFMNKFNSFISKYGNGQNTVISARLIDSNDVILNLYVNLDKDKIIEIKPMLIEEMPKEDIKIEADFDKLYNMIEGVQKDMKETQTQSPPWDTDFHAIEKFEEIKNGIKVWLRMRNMINSAKVTPDNANSDIKSLIRTFIWETLVHGGNDNIPEETVKDQENKDDLAQSITGQVIREY